MWMQRKTVFHSLLESAEEQESVSEKTYPEENIQHEDGEYTENIATPESAQSASNFTNQTEDLECVQEAS